jgi:hypothetical protein
VRISSAVLSALLVASPLATQAQDVGQHPAVFAPRQLPGVDPSTFIVGHPASPNWRLAHANDDHPAVVVKRDWAAQAIDPNTFVVQPPAHVQWIAPSPVEVVVAGTPMEVPGS